MFYADIMLTHTTTTTTLNVLYAWRVFAATPHHAEQKMRKQQTAASIVHLQLEIVERNV